MFCLFICFVQLNASKVGRTCLLSVPSWYILVTNRGIISLAFIKSFRNMVVENAEYIFYFSLGSDFWLAPVLTYICPWCFQIELLDHTGLCSVEALGLWGLHKRLKILLFSCQVLRLQLRQPAENSLHLCAWYPTLDPIGENNADCISSSSKQNWK